MKSEMVYFKHYYIFLRKWLQFQSRLQVFVLLRKYVKIKKLAPCNIMYLNFSGQFVIRRFLPLRILNIICKSQTRWQSIYIMNFGGKYEIYIIRIEQNGLRLKNYFRYKIKGQNHLNAELNVKLDGHLETGISISLKFHLQTCIDTSDDQGVRHILINLWKII